MMEDRSELKHGMGFNVEAVLIGTCPSDTGRVLHGYKSWVGAPCHCFGVRRESSVWRSSALSGSSDASFARLEETCPCWKYPRPILSP